MKKALAFLLAFALVGAFVFAQDEAPAKIDFSPVITYGLNASAGWNMYNSYAISGRTNADFSLFEYVDLPLFGYDYRAGLLFKTEGWFQVDMGPFWMKALMGYKASRRDNTGYLETAPAFDQIVKISNGISFEGLSFTNTLAFDPNNYGDSGYIGMTIGFAVYDWVELTVEKDNVTGGVLALAGWPSNPFDKDTTLPGIALTTINDMSIVDWNFTVTGILDMLDISIGGTDNNWSTNFRDYGLFGNLTAANYQTSSRTYNGLFYSGSVDEFPAVATFHFEKLLGVNANLNLASIVPASNNFKQTTLFIDWLEKGNLVSADLSLDGIGKFTAGANLAILTPRNTQATANFNYRRRIRFAMPGDDRLMPLIPFLDYTAGVNSHSFLANSYYVAPWGAHLTTATPPDFVMSSPTSAYFLDAKLTMVENLTLQASVDIVTGKYMSVLLNSWTGTGTATDPYKFKAIDYTKLYIGLEGEYKLDAVLPGLTASAGVYLASVSGMDWESYAGANLPTTGLYIREGFQNRVMLGTSPFQLGVSATYAFAENKQSLVLEDIFTSQAMYVVDAAFCDTNALSLTYKITAGLGTIALKGAYTMYLNVPTAANLNITGAQQIIDYNVTMAQMLRPISLNVSYTAKF